jgi:hypothetical protein
MSNSYKVMGDFLQRHAYQNVWCTPDQDKQAIFKPARITRDNGTWSTITVMWRTYRLPDETSRFHVYQLGQVHPMLLGLAAAIGEWKSVAQTCIDESLIVDLYTVTGVQIHRTQAYYLVTAEKNLVLVVRIPNKTKVPIDLNTDDLYIRLYSNAFYNTLRADGVDDIVHVEGRVITSTQDILDVQQNLATWNTRSIGHCYCFINGFRVDAIDMITARVGDLVEFVYDGSIKLVVSFPVSDLQQFTSTLDQNSKYLLHHSQPSTTIDYIDDIDVFLVKPLPNSRYKGIYFHKNNPAALRMVTHKDYSVPVQYLASYAQQRPELGSNVDNLVVELHIRKAGYQRELVLEHQRIAQLYTLPDDDVTRAMAGIDSTVSVWTAAALEASGYTALMRARLGDISTELVQNAYGYNAASKLVGDTPTHVEVMGNIKFINVPIALQNESTAYEYDSDGLLLGWSVHTGSSVYVAQYEDTALIEMMFGAASESLQTFWDQQTSLLPVGYNYRFYTCGKSGQLIDNNWVDRTDSGYYAIINGAVEWAVNSSNTYTVVRGNKNHLTYELEYYAVDSLIAFTLREYHTELQTYRVLPFPPGKIEIFLNGKSLIETLDYFIDFPRVVVTNKEYLDNPHIEAQKIVVRMTGFCDNQLDYEQVQDVGFVRYGVLSMNNRFDVRGDKVNRIVVDGALYRFDEFEYAESDFDVHVTDARNGSPYSITDIVVPMNSHLHSEDTRDDPTYRLRALSREVDVEVSDYLSLKIPEKDPEEPSAITERYRIVSPFFSKIIYDLISGALWQQRFTEHYGEDYVREMCLPYEYLLATDPIKEGLTPNTDFVTIHPHNLNNYVDMGIYQYKFLNRVVTIYGLGKIEISSHVRVLIFGEE